MIKVLMQKADVILGCLLPDFKLTWLTTSLFIIRHGSEVNDNAKT